MFLQCRRKSLPSQVFYHGTPMDFQALMPKPNQRRSQEKIEWSGEAIFATQDIRISLNYTANKIYDENITTGVDLCKSLHPHEPMRIVVFGGIT